MRAFYQFLMKEVQVADRKLPCWFKESGVTSAQTRTSATFHWVCFYHNDANVLRCWYLQHRGPLSVASSLPSPQSSAPSQTKLVGTHLPLSHVNSSVGSHTCWPEADKKTRGDGSASQNSFANIKDRRFRDEYGSEGILGLRSRCRLFYFFTGRARGTLFSPRLQAKGIYGRRRLGGRAGAGGGRFWKTSRRKFELQFHKVIEDGRENETQVTTKSDDNLCILNSSNVSSNRKVDIHKIS